MSILIAEALRRLRIEMAFTYAKVCNRVHRKRNRKRKSASQQPTTHEVALDWTWRWEHADKWEGIYWYDSRDGINYCLR